jgi:ferrous iron transport protein B
MKKRNGKSIGNNGVGSNQSGLKNNLQEHAPKGRAYPEVALCGNPNCGKTSLFNCLTGGHQHVGNWGGVTVELKQGRSRIAGEVVTIVDLPGTYSLSAFSMEERVARDFILEEKPDVVIDVIDTSNLERNLYLTVQLMELGVRPVLAFNMWDEVEQKGLRIDLPLLSKLLDLQIGRAHV